MEVDYIKKFVFLGGNIMPILVSIIIYSVITQNKLHLWAGYNAVIAPVYLLVFNFALDHKRFYINKLFIIFFVELVCLLIHMAYFKFDFNSITLIIWSLMFIEAIGITAAGGKILIKTGVEKHEEYK